VSLFAAFQGAEGSVGGSEEPGADIPRPAPPPPPEARVLVYGDSLWHHGDASTCDLCSLFPDHIVVTNYAVSATYIWPHPLCDGLYDGLPSIPDPECIAGEDRSLRKPVDADPSHDVCFSAKDAASTCIVDNPDQDVLLVQYGTNDIRTNPHDGPWTTEAGLFEGTLEKMLLERPAGMACVLVIPPPIWSEDYTLLNARLENVASIVEDAAARHGCEIADLYGLYLDIEATQGDGATLPLYASCSHKGSTVGDCVHWSLPYPVEPAQEIVNAIDRARAAIPRIPLFGALGTTRALVVLGLLMSACARPGSRRQ
jgi:hypothetical protein